MTEQIFLTLLDPPDQCAVLRGTRKQNFEIWIDFYAIFLWPMVIDFLFIFELHGYVLTFMLKLLFHSFTKVSARRSFHVMRLWKGLPVDFFHVVKVDRWVLIPILLTSFGEIFASEKINKTFYKVYNSFLVLLTCLPQYYIQGRNCGETLGATSGMLSRICPPGWHRVKVSCY